MSSAVSKWRRRVGRALTFSFAIALVVAVVPARFRDRNGSRSSARACGAPRWDVHLDDCELPLHVSTSEWYATRVGGSLVSKTTPDHDATRDSSAPSVRDESIGHGVSVGDTLFVQTLAVFSAEAFVVSAPSRAPPA